MPEPGGSLDRLRVDVVGSLLRPPSLKDVYDRHGQGGASDTELRQAQDDAIREAVAHQETVGLPVVTDGEFRRLNFQDSFAASIAGLGSGGTRTIRFHEERTTGGTPLQRWDPGYTGEGPAVVVRSRATERLRLVRNQPLEEYRFTSSVAARPVKVSLIGADRIVQRFDAEGSRAVYPDADAFLEDVVALERGMAGDLVAAGCRYVQIDAPGFTAYVDPPSLEAMRARGEDPMANLERSIRAENAIVAGFPGVTFGIHVCRGNQRSMWHREGTYDAIAERLFSSLAHQRLLLEYDSERAGGFEPLRFVPPGKVVVLGLVTTKVGTVETRDELLRRIDAAARLLPVEQLALSPQCGFASDIVGNLLSEDEQWRKLELICRVAEEVWRGAA